MNGNSGEGERRRARRSASSHGATRRWAFGALATVALLAGGCGDSDDAGSTSTAAPSTSAQYPVTIRNCGRTVTYDKAPSRVVMPYHPQAEMLVGLGLADKAVGRVGFEGALKTPPLLPEQAADFKSVPVISDNNFPPPKEKMLTLRPDFLLAYGDFDYGGKHEGVEGLATLKDLTAAGVNVYTVVCPDKANKFTAETLEATYRSILDLGKIFNISERAEKRVAEMKAKIADIKEKVAGEPVAKVVAYGGGKGPVSLAGGQTIISQIIEAAGGENVFADKDPFFEASLEAVAGKQADAYVIFADYEEATDKLDGTKEAQFLFKAFPGLQASKDRRFAVTDYVYTAPGWRVADTVEDIARQLHPDAFK